MSEKREIPFGRPWITEEGKQAVRNNGMKHGWRSEDIRAVRRLLRAQRDYVRAVEARLTAKDGDA